MATRNKDLKPTYSSNYLLFLYIRLKEIYCYLILLYFRESCGSQREPIVVRLEEGNLLLLGLLGEEYSLDVRQDTSLGNGHTREELVQLFVVSDGQLQMSWDDTGLLVVTGSITGQLQNFSGQVFHDSSEVHWGTSTNTLGIVALAQKPVDPSDGELKSSPGATGL